jgi:hypothetical protein
MKFDLFFDLKGPGGEVHVPNTKNPIESENLSQLLIDLGQNFPKFGFGVEVTGIIIKESNVRS